MQDNKESYFYATIYFPNSFISLMHKKNGFPIFPSLDKSSFPTFNNQQASNWAKQCPLVLLTREHLFG
jgi:hypothetical protein